MGHQEDLEAQVDRHEALALTAQTAAAELSVLGESNRNYENLRLAKIETELLKIEAAVHILGSTTAHATLANLVGP